MADTDKVKSRAAYFDKAAPGVYLEEEFALPRRTLFTTGVPAFLGALPSLKDPANKHKPVMLTLWSQFEARICSPAPRCDLAYAVRGFFANGGTGCYVVPLERVTESELEIGLDNIGKLDTIDLVCAPDLVSISNRAEAFRLQQILVKHCEEAGDRFAILDSFRGDGNDNVWEQWSQIDGANGAIYYPWVKVLGFDRQIALVPPCGHIAGVYARTDRTRGVHKAPANELLEGVVGLERDLTSYDQSELNPKHINCLRSFPGRGIRVWGARTLSGQPAWTYVNVRRLFLTAVRWIHWHMTEVVFEPNQPNLWARIERELNAYFMDLYHAGALKGDTPQEAFYVKCDEETNPQGSGDVNQVVTEIGLAPAIPYEFVIVRVIQGPSGVSILGPTLPEES
jgi:hypothetical protein